MTSRALALLAAFASPVFMAAAIAGWLYDAWPATPLTLAVSALFVVGGPIMAILHVATARQYEEYDAYEDEPQTLVLPVAVLPVAAPEPAPFPLTPKAASARAFLNWRDQAHPAIDRRERERRASRYVRS